MRRLVLISALLASLLLGFAAPAAAAERDARIVGITAGFRQSLVDVTSLTYDPAMGVARLTLTVHCFVGYYMEDSPSASSLEFWDAAVVQRSKPFTVTSRHSHPAAIFYESATITDAAPCVEAQNFGITAPDQTIVFTFNGLEPGYATFRTMIVTGIFSGHVHTTTLIRAVLPAR